MPSEYDVVTGLIVWGLIFGAAIIAALLWLLSRLYPKPPVPLPGPAARVVFVTGRFPYEVITMLNISATGKPRTLRLAFVDAEDNPTQPPANAGAPVWAPIDPVLGSLEVAPDGQTAVFTPGSPSSGQISVVVGLEDGTTITGTLDVVVTPGDAVRIAINVDPE